MRPRPVVSWGVGKVTPIVSAIAPTGSCLARKSEEWDILFTKSYTDGAVQGELLEMQLYTKGAVGYIPTISFS